ncbi:MAG TPA: hypothetical protein VFP56_05725 [Candidatus Limnocylindrales bacterium]|nr:hypothetical protein [Candidatus Limnocylindrales bacterium]
MPASSRCPLATYAGDRLLGSSGLATSSGSYEYDLDGNRVKRVEGGSTTTFSYDRADQTREQVIGGTTKTFSYDPYGNLTQSADNANASRPMGTTRRPG